MRVTRDARATGTRYVRCARQARRFRRSGLRRSGLRRAQHSQMTPAPDLHRVRAPRSLAPGLGRAFLGAGRFPYGVGQRFEIVTAGTGRGRAVREPDDLPAAGRGQPLAVLRAQVVAVRLGVGGERAEYRRRVGIDVRQCRDGRAAARGARTATYRAHDVGRYRTLERAATTLPPATPPCRMLTGLSRWPETTGLTCTERGVTGRRQPVTQLRLGANRISEGERDDHTDLWK